MGNVLCRVSKTNTSAACARKKHMHTRESEASAVIDRFEAGAHKAGFGEMAVESSAICYIWMRVWAMRQTNGALIPKV